MQFPEDAIIAAQDAQRKWGVPASVTLAQWALESNWGRDMPEGSNNPFGIKAVAGQPSVTVPTREVVHGRSVWIKAAFRKFVSLAEAFDDHGRLLATAKPYEHAMTLVDDPEAFAHALAGVYATDPHYGAALVNLMYVDNSLRYDLPTTTA